MFDLVPAVCCSTSLPAEQAFRRAAGIIEELDGDIWEGDSSMIAADATFIAALRMKSGSGGGGFAVGLPNDEPGATQILVYIFPETFQKKKVHAWLRQVRSTIAQTLPDGRESSAHCYSLLMDVV